MDEGVVDREARAQRAADLVLGGVELAAQQAEFAGRLRGVLEHQFAGGRETDALARAQDDLAP